MDPTRPTDQIIFPPFPSPYFPQILIHDSDFLFAFRIRVCPFSQSTDPPSWYRKAGGDGEQFRSSLLAVAKHACGEQQGDNWKSGRLAEESAEGKWPPYPL
jgi:hypothetical protein